MQRDGIMSLPVAPVQRTERGMALLRTALVCTSSEGTGAHLPLPSLQHGPELPRTHHFEFGTWFRPSLTSELGVRCRWEAQPGQKPTRSVHGDLWALDTESWTWRQIVQSAGELWPTSRSAMGMVAVGEGLLLYGGRGIGTGFLGDLWLFSPSSGRWYALRLLSTCTSSSLRCLHARK